LNLVAGAPVAWWRRFICRPVFSGARERSRGTSSWIEAARKGRGNASL